MVINSLNNEQNEKLINWHPLNFDSQNIGLSNISISVIIFIV